MLLGRPFLSQVLLLWVEARANITAWSDEFKDFATNGKAMTVFLKRFKKTYRPAWAAAYLLDPLFLEPNDDGSRYFPPIKNLTREEELGVQEIFLRLTPYPADHPTVVMELMGWKLEGAHPLYAQAVQQRTQVCKHIPNNVFGCLIIAFSVGETSILMHFISRHEFVLF
jgi:hypothetical protein